MQYIPGLPNNPPSHLVEYFHNKAMVESVKKQLNFVIGCLLNSLQNKAASLDPVRLYMEQLVLEKFNGPITLDYLSKGIDYANFCVATKDLLNIRQGWPKLSDDVSIGVSAAFVLNNESTLSQLPPQLIPIIQNSANAFSTELSAAINFSSNGSINMQQYQQYPQQFMPQQGVQQFPAQGNVQQFMQTPMQMMPQQPMMQQPMMMPQQQPQINQQQLMMILQQNPQLAMMYQQNPQAAMQMIMQQMQAQQMQNPYMQRANTVSGMPMQQQMPMQAPVQGFINQGQQFGQVNNNQVGTARGSSFAKAPSNTPPHQVQLNTNPSNGMIQTNPQQPQGNFNQQPQQFQPQPTAVQPSVQHQITGANVVHGGNVQPVNMTQQIQPVQNPNTVPQFAVETNRQQQTYPQTNYSNLADEATVVDSVRAVADGDMVYDIQGRRIGSIYNRDKEIVTVSQDEKGIVVADYVEEAKVKYEEHESQRILPSRTKAEKRATPSTEKMNQVLELAYNEVSYSAVLDKIKKDQEASGEELVDVDVTRVITELGTNAVRLDKPLYVLNKTSILPIISMVLDKNKIPADTTTRSVSADIVLGGPLAVNAELAGAVEKLNKTSNLNEYISALEAINRLDIPNYQWSWIHDEVLKEINNFLEKYFGLSISIDSVLVDLDELIDYIAENYGNDISSQLYINLHSMLTATVLQLFRRDEWPDIVDEGQILLGKVYRVVTLPLLTCQVPYNAPGKSGIVDRNTHTQLVNLLDRMISWREDYHSMLLITLDNDIIEVNSTTIDGNYIMYCGNE